MPRLELTGKRPLNYSQWHRKLGPWYYALDADWFELRQIKGKMQIVALIETIQVPESKVDIAYKAYPVTKFKETAYKLIVELIKVPYYVVWHNEKCTKFCVLNYAQKRVIIYNEKDYAQFLKGLGEKPKLLPPDV